MATDQSFATAGFPAGATTKTLAKRLQIRLPGDQRLTAAVPQVSGATSRHQIEFRVSFPTLFWGTRYVTLFSGEERRSEDRLRQEGQTKWTRRTLFFLTILAVTSLFALFGLFCLLYLMKSVLGINLMSRPSPFHPLFSLFLAR